ncbi:sensor domain-containing phosphodiesterase [Methylobacterium sp. Leaf118]|uniref:sensor domain-containing phosphodiesterase n=1 Tax=Methylobacterium sp. Leaf118 TaxID=2876562 RepID=UPI001E50B033|nr:EAL domain-containing protein [Methylobacterium sp. Leaf118]
MSLAHLFDAGPGTAGEQVQAILQAVRRHLAMDVGFVSEFVSGNRVFRFTDGRPSRNPVTVGASDPLEKSFCYYVARGMMPELMHDAVEDPIAAGLSVTHELPVGAHLSVPLRHADGTAYGSVCCFSFTPDRSLTTRDLGLLRLCADLVGAVLSKDRRAALDLEARRARIRAVIEAEAVEIAYQPIYRVADGRLMAFEALARFGDASRRGPDAWFAEAATVGLDEDLEFLALRRALSGCAALDPALRLTVNLSPARITSPRFEAAFAGVPLERIVLELTEHAAVACYDALRRALMPLRARGLRLAIDDVGAGHATFRHVLDLSPELIKLDMSLIRGIDGDPARRALAEAITAYGRRIGCEVVAEGVETSAEYVALRDIGVTRAQGYLLGRPMPIAQARGLPLSAAVPD